MPGSLRGCVLFNVALRKIVFLLIGMFSGILLSAPAGAVTATLAIGSATIYFPAASPAEVPSIAAGENPVSVTVRVQNNASGSWHLTVLAAGDLMSGSNTIPIGKITWAASGSGFVGGTMSKTTPQTAGSGTNGTNDETVAGTFSYFFSNGWGYATGAYSQNLTYTLSAP